MGTSNTVEKCSPAIVSDVASGLAPDYSFHLSVPRRAFSDSEYLLSRDLVPFSWAPDRYAMNRMDAKNIYVVVSGIVAFVALPNPAAQTPLWAILDADMVPRVWDFRWSASQASAGKFYAISGRGGKRTRMHRLLLNAPDDLFVDHANSNPLDNRLCNLRFATEAQNSQNSAGRSVRKHPYKGIEFHGSWRAAICIGGKKVRLPGTFPDAESAARAYDAAAIEVHGRFARLNFQEVPRG